MNAAHNLIDFSEWLDAVNKLVELATGRNIDQLPKWCWRNAYERNLTPGESVALWSRQLKRLAARLEKMGTGITSCR
jgi:hypothetical protein